MLALAALLLTNAILGPIGVGLLDYPLPTSLFNQLVGLELVTVFLVVPTLAAAAALARRGHPAAPLLGIGPCGYAAYMFVQYVVGPDRTSYSPAVLIQLLVFSAATALSVWSWSLARGRRGLDPTRINGADGDLLLVGLAAFVLLRYLPLFVGSVTGSAIPREFARRRRSSGRSWCWTSGSSCQRPSPPRRCCARLLPRRPGHARRGRLVRPGAAIGGRDGGRHGRA